MIHYLLSKLRGECLLSLAPLPPSPAIKPLQMEYSLPWPQPANAMTQANRGWSNDTSKQTVKAMRHKQLVDESLAHV